MKATSSTSSPTTGCGSPKTVGHSPLSAGPRRPAAYRTIDSRRLCTYGEAYWHAPEPDGEFAYLEVSVDEIVYNRVEQGRRALVERPVGDLVSE
jgi:hypothetical protein